MKRLYLYIVDAVDIDYTPKISSVKEGMSAPNVVNNLITLGTCKPKIRTSIRKKFDKFDNYIVGLSPSRTDPRRVLYIMHVCEWITFSEAWERGEKNETYQLKRGGHSPLSNDSDKVRMNGDIIVRSDDGVHYNFVGGVHENDWDTYVIGAKTIGAERDVYVVGNPNTSQYFWDKGPLITKSMLKHYWKGYPQMRGHRVLHGNDAESIINELHLL
jgi:hypothetical protein